MFVFRREIPLIDVFFCKKMSEITFFMSTFTKHPVKSFFQEARQVFLIFCIIINEHHGKKSSRSLSLRITTYKHRSMFLIKNEVGGLLLIKSHFNILVFLPRFDFWVAKNDAPQEIRPNLRLL